MKMFALAAAPLAALLAAGPVAAFEPFNTFLAIVEPALDGSEAFNYSAPHEPLTEYEPGDPLIWPTDRALSKAMMEPGPATAMTGVDFTAVTGVFVAGRPPNLVTVLQGTEGFAHGAPEMLAEREYEESTVSGFRVFAFGEDNAINRDMIHSGDPFGGTLGKSQRLAIADDYLVLTFSWDDAKRALSRLETSDTCAGCLPWRQLSSSLENVASDRATLEAAVGYDVTAFAVTLDPTDLFGPNGELILPDPEKAEEPDPVRALPPFLYAMLAVTRDGDNATAHIAAIFPDDSTAATGGSVIIERIEGQMAELEASDPATTHEAIVSETVDADMGTIAVVSVQFAPEAQDAALRYYVRWLNLIYSRKFTVLSVF
jgi:hypothetical protein